MSRIYPYAGFWKRALAFLIDSFVLGLCSFVIYVPFLLFGFRKLALLAENPQSAAENMKAVADTYSTSLINVLVGVYGTAFLFLILSLVLFWLYYALQESGKKQATLGKRAVGLKVVGADGRRISFARATGRTFGKYISSAILYFGFYMAGFTKKRQALHDIMADSYVVDEKFQPENELPELPFGTGGLIASIIAAVLPVVLWVVLFAAMIVAAASAAEDGDLNTLDFSTLGTQVTAAQAQAGLILWGLDDDGNTPQAEDGIQYSRQDKNYRADFTARNGNHYTLLLTPDAEDVCCVGNKTSCAPLEYPICK